jgi:hypothetical protein
MWMKHLSIKEVMVAKKNRVVTGELMIEEIDWLLEYVGS